MNNSTADLSDQYPEKVRAAAPLFNDYGGNKNFSGEIVTLKIFEDNSLVRKILETDGKNKVLVVDGGGSMRCALLGDLLAALAVKNNWEGIVINGCIRDSGAISQLPLGVKALGKHPLKTVKRNEGQENIHVTFAGVDFFPTHFLYADEDGILIASEKLQ